MSTHQSGDGGIDRNTVNGRVAGHNVMVGGISAVNGGYNLVHHGDNHFHASSVPNEVRKSVKPFAQLYFPRNEDFIDRPDITEWLEKTLKNPGSRAALWGLGGIGKSQFAIRYAQDLEQRSPETFIFWIYARTRDLFITGYREIAEKLGLLPDPSEADETVLLAVRDWCNKNKQWLMILDNADDANIFKNTTTSEASASDDGSAIKAQPPDLSDFLPRGQTGNLLITSRDKAVAHFLAGHRNARVVPVMTEHEAIQLLRKKLGDYNDEDCEVALVQALDCVPLAITQAASYIAFEADTGFTTPAKYLELLRFSDQERVSLLSKVTVDDPFREPGTSPAVVTTWKITFSRVKETNANAAYLLSLMSFFHNQGIPQWIFEKIYAIGDEQNSGQALAKDLSLLCRYSLVTCFQIQDGDRKERHGATFRSQQYQMHALVQACTRAWLEESGEKEDFQRHYINSLGVFHPDPCFESWTECGELSPHVESLLNLPGLEHLDKDRAPFLCRMLSRAGNYNIKTGRLDRAMILLTKALHVAEKTFYPGHYYIFRAVGDLWKLRDLFGKHHSLQIKITGAAKGLHKSLLGILLDPANNDAALESYGLPVEDIHHDHLTSEHKEALLLFHELRALGPDVLRDSGYHVVRFIHNAPPCSFTSLILGLLAKLIETLKFVAKDAEKETICRAILHRRIQFPDEDWLGKAGMSEDGIWRALVDAMQKQGKYEEASDLLDQRGTQLELPDAHGTVRCFTLVTSISSLMYQRKWEEAEKGNRELLEFLKRTIGFLDPDLLGVRMYIVACLTQQGKHMAAVEELGNIVELRKELLGSEHPDTLEAIVSLGRSLSYLGRYVQAEALLRGCLATLERNFEEKIESSTYCRAITTLCANLEVQGKTKLQPPGFWAHLIKVAPDVEEWALKQAMATCNGRQGLNEDGQVSFVEDESDINEEKNIKEDQSPAQQWAAEGTASALVPIRPNTISRGVAMSNLAHNHGIADVAYQDNLQNWEENAMARAIEQLHIGERMLGRNNTSRPEMCKLLAIELGKRMSLYANRALRGCIGLLEEVKKGAGRDLPMD